MKTNKIHYAQIDRGGDSLIYCKQEKHREYSISEVKYTQNITKVTCKNCLKLLNK